MKSKNFLLISFSAAALLAQTGVAPDILLQPLRDSWPTYNGDYTGSRYSSLAQIDQIHRQEPHPGLGLPPDRRHGQCRTRRLRPRRRAQQHHHRRRRPRRFSGRRRHHQSLRPGSQRHALRLHAGQRVGGGCARWPRTLALLLEDQRRHPHRQSRSGHVEQLPLHGNARRLSGLARRQNRQGALAQGDRRSRRRGISPRRPRW